MLLALLSDVHANLPALEAVLADARQHRPDAYLIAGDLSGGPQASETLEALRTLPARIIRGNGEGYLMRFWHGDAPVAWQTQRQFGFVRWCANRLGEDERSFICGLPEELRLVPSGCASVRVVHGSPGRPNEGIDPANSERAPAQALALVDEAALVCGHTHKQWQTRIDGRLAVNPGAVCGPCDGTIGAQYALLRWRGGEWRAELKKVNYNTGEVRRAFRESGLLEEGGWFARAVVLGIETGVDVARALLQHASRYKEAQGWGSERFMPDEVWDAAAERFDWQRYERGGQ